MGAGNCIGCCLGVEFELDQVGELVEELLSSSWVVSSDRVAMTVCEFCNGWCEFFRAGVLGVCPTDNSSSFRINSAGIASVKTGVGGNSTPGGGDAMENDWEKALDAMETRRDPDKTRLLGRDELVVLLLPSAWRRMSARRVMNSTSMGFLGI